MEQGGAKILEYFYKKVAKGEEKCPENCFWKGCCLKGTKFDDGKGGLLPGKFAPWLDYSGYSPCFMVSPGKNTRIKPGY
jgi:hypothetical protein